MSTNNPNELKSAEEWLDIINDSCLVVEVIQMDFCDVIKQIQLNAYKAGMSEAAEICKSFTHELSQARLHYYYMSDKILSARDNKTSL